MKVELVRATERDRATLSNLVQLYVHDFSELLGLMPAEDGTFSYPKLPLYWQEPGRIPYLIRADGRLAGFALLSRGSLVSGDPGVWDVAEFFVVRGVRRKGVGLAAAQELFRTNAGSWEVRVNDANVTARPFWQRAVQQFTDGRFTAEPWTRPDGSTWQVFRFTAGLP